MPQINVPESRHVGPAFIPGVTLKYLPYANARFLGILRSAIAVIGSRIVRNLSCNSAFAALPGRRAFRDVWADTRIWINFDPSRNGEDFGETNGFDITITEYPRRIKISVGKACIYPLEAGKRYLLYLSRSGDGVSFATKRCRGNRPSARAGVTLTWLGANGREFPLPK